MDSRDPLLEVFALIELVDPFSFASWWSIINAVVASHDSSFSSHFDVTHLTSYQSRLKWNDVVRGRDLQEIDCKYQKDKVNRSHKSLTFQLYRCNRLSFYNFPNSSKIELPSPLKSNNYIYTLSWQPFRADATGPTVLAVCRMYLKFECFSQSIFPWSLYHYCTHMNFSYLFMLWK